MVCKTIGVLSLALALLAAPVALAEEREWDQAEVSALVKELIGVVSKIQVTAKAADDPANEEARAQVADDLKLLKKQLRRVNDSLITGKGRTASWPEAKHAERLIVRTRKTASELPILEGQEANIDKANQLIAEIGQYYGADPRPDVATPPAD
jgi:predicted O-linked N-acetylglucosamine transferase (SPINDLY family)